MQKVLILAPHTDDAELGCGGSMARFIEEKYKLHIAVFSSAEDSLPKGIPPTIIRDEFIRASQILGLTPDDYTIFDFPVRNLTSHRQRVLDELLKLRAKLSPDLILLPSSSDLHQDHQVVCTEGLRAFKDLTVWGYELPWNHISFPTNAFVTFQERHLKLKWDAIKEYQSQFSRPYLSFDFVRSLAKVRGVQVKAEYAEAFEVIRIRY